MINLFLKITFFCFLLFLFFFFHTTNAVVVDSFLNPAVGTTTLPEFLNDFYNFSILISGIIAVGMIIFGGVYIIFSGAMPDKEREGRDMILGALWGLVLLLGSYFILKTVNPELIKLKEPGGDLAITVSYDDCKAPEGNTSGTGNDGIVVSSKLEFCKLDEYPRDPETGACKCYVTKEWESVFSQQENNAESSSLILDCKESKKETGTQAGKSIVSLGESFKGKLKYELGGDVVGGTADCSSFVGYLYQCVMSKQLGNSSAIYSMNMPPELEKKTGADQSFFKKLKPGDLIGYSRKCRCNDTGNCGHIMIVNKVDENGPIEVLEQGGACKGPGSCISSLGGMRKAKVLHNCGVMVHIKGND